MATAYMEGLLLVVLAFVALTASFPMKIPELNPKYEIGEKFYISNVEDLMKLGNGTVPDALLSELTPPEYFKKFGANPGNMMSHLYHSSSSTQKRRQRSIQSSCPVTWTISFEADRWPSRIQKAVCNGDGTTCLSSDGKRSCEEYYIETQVYRYLGQTSSGQQVWRSEKQSTPVLCTCTGF